MPTETAQSSYDVHVFEDMEHDLQILVTVTGYGVTVATRDSKPAALSVWGPPLEEVTGWE